MTQKKPAIETKKQNREKIALEKSEPDPEWLKVEVEKAKRNVVKPERDTAQSEQRHEAAKF
jgi:hypothetical protein